MGTKYTSVTVSGYNSAPPADDGSTAASNQVKWSTQKSKLSDPLKTAVEAINSGVVTALDFSSRSITTSDSAIASDHMKTIEIASTVSSVVTVTLSDAATMASGYCVELCNRSGFTALVTRATASDVIDNTATAVNLLPLSVVGYKVNASTNGYLTRYRGTVSNVSGGSSSSGGGFMGLTASVGSNALTVTLASGTVLNFNNGTSVTLGGNISVTASSGSTLGTVSGQASKLWVVAVKNSGTPELALMNALSGTNIAPINLGGTISTTAEGGAGAADSAQVWYSTTARASQPFCVVGYVESTQATAGTWASSPTAQGYGPGVPLPGTPMQAVFNSPSAVATGTTAIPLDDTIPQNTEGDQYMSQAITPISAANVLDIQVVALLSGSASDEITGALFQDTTANALCAVLVDVSTTNRGGTIPMNYTMVAGTTSSTTFKFRAGLTSAGTTTFNGRISARLYGAIPKSMLRITEIVA